MPATLLWPLDSGHFAILCKIVKVLKDLHSNKCWIQARSQGKFVGGGTLEGRVCV